MNGKYMFFVSSTKKYTKKQALSLWRQCKKIDVEFVECEFPDGYCSWFQADNYGESFNTEKRLAVEKIIKNL
jgi:hypothetical protein